MSISAQWLAGFFDGEGCLTVYGGTRKSSRHYTPAVVFTNTHLYTLKEIQKDFGGSLHIRTKVKGWNQGYTLVFSGAKASKRILELMLPYLFTKKNEVEFFLKEWYGKVHGQHGIKVPPEQLAIREEIKQQLSALKSRNNIPQEIN